MVEATMTPDLVFRKGRQDDLPRIAEFRKEYFGHSLIRSHETEYYRWKCYNNPVMAGEMWLAEDCGRLVGMKNVTPKLMKMLGKIIPVAEMGDSFTHPDYQRRGIFTTLSKASRESMLQQGVNLIYNTPNKNSLPGYLRRLDHAVVPIAVRNLAKPVFPRPALKKMLPAPFLAYFLSPPLEVISRIMSAVGKACIGRNGITVSEVSSFPDDIDGLWEELSGQYDVSLVRNGVYLEWRYVVNPDTYSILIARDESDVLRGFMVTKIGFEEDVALAYIADFLVPEARTDILAELLAGALHRFYQQKVSSVAVWSINGSRAGSVFRRFGFIPRAKSPLLCYQNEVGRELSSRVLKWHLTMGDTDNI